jgi:hypothetical protein
LSKRESEQFGTRWSVAASMSVIDDHGRTARPNSDQMTPRHSVNHPIGNVNARAVGSVILVNDRS